MQGFCQKIHYCIYFISYFNFTFRCLGPTPSKGELQTLTACEVGFFDNCINTYEIDVKNCSTFLVYKLNHWMFATPLTVLVKSITFW